MPDAVAFLIAAVPVAGTVLPLLLLARSA